jgi:hypothetical protein
MTGGSRRATGRQVQTTDWAEWHRRYDDGTGPLARRLEVVTDVIRVAIHAAPAGTVHCVSLCSGEARDLVGALDAHPRAGDVVGVAAELDPALAATAARSLAAVAPGLRVVVGDAGDVELLVPHLPADILVLAGIFGNVSDDDVARTIAAAPAMCHEGATIVWTRHRTAPDLTPRIRRQFDDAGCTEVAFTSPGPGDWAVGVERVVSRRPDASMPTRLFAFR